MTLSTPANTSPRIVGHGRTFWLWNGKVIAWGQRVTHTPAQPLAQAVDVIPINYVRPVVIAPPRAITRGEITMEIIEPYEGRAWDVLADKGGGPMFAATSNQPGARDLADVFHAFQTSGEAPTLTRIIRPPASGTKTSPIIVEEYKGIQILNVDDGEEGSSEAMTNTVTITVGYTSRERTSTATGADPAVGPEEGGRRINSQVHG